MDLGLFRSPRFTWGTILQAFGIFAMFGLLFAAPQFFQAILGVYAMGSGVRLLPLMAGLALGAGLADQVAARLTTKLTAALGFTLLTAGLVLGATMTVASGNAFIATWTAITGVGFGLALATAASAALVDLPKERAGVGSAVMQAVQKAGAPLSAAVLGSVLSVGLPLPARPGGAARAAPRTRCAAACSRASRWRARPARRRCWTRCAPRSCTGPTRCCGSAPGWRGGIVLALLFLPWRATAGRRSRRLLPARAAEGAESAHERVA